MKDAISKNTVHNHENVSPFIGTWNLHSKDTFTIWTLDSSYDSFIYIII